eukprot:GHRR01024023.1.p1 GENE.GHRR01024023.1~~GHRR01024023.1.p1  ORF type:complete len:260 (+),score=71.80 GHRR01024023.1:341-1120(+)
MHMCSQLLTRVGNVIVGNVWLVEAHTHALVAVPLMRQPWQQLPQPLVQLGVSPLSSAIICSSQFPCILLVPYAFMLLNYRQQLQQQLAQLGVPLNDLDIYSSPFSRTVETAHIAAVAGGINPARIQETPLLRERFFGAALELTTHDNYCPAWASDAVDPRSKPAGNQDGESVLEVSARIQRLFQQLEQQHQGRHIQLVSHGDTLSVLMATFYGTPLTQHRDYGLQTAQLKALKAEGMLKQSKQGFEDLSLANGIACSRE